MKTIISFLVVALLCVPVCAETFGLGESETPTTIVNHASTFGLGQVFEAPPEKVCVVGPDGIMRCYDVPVKTTVRTVTRSVPTFGLLAPRGYHRHVMVDGSVIEHHDSNYGSAVAHRGVAGRGWPKYYGPILPTKTVTRSTVSAPVQQMTAVDCPSCPSGVAYQMQTIGTTGETYYTRTVQRRAIRPVRNFFGWFAANRSARLSARAYRFRY